MSYLLKLVGYSVWALAFALSVALAWDFHQGQNHIALGVAVLALIVSASGLLMARYSWQRGDYLVMFLGFSLWLAGAVSFTFTELGFWTSSYNERHAEYVQGKSTKARQEGLTDRAWKALTTGEMPPSPAVLKARIKAAQQHERWGPSKGCTEATVTESRTFCNGYFELEAQLAAAEQLQKFEGQILGSSEAKPEVSYVHDVFALAASLARWLGTDDEKQAAEYIILSTWILLLLARDTGLLIANPLGRHREAVTVALRKPQVEPEAEPKPPVSAQPEPQEKATTEIALQHRPVVQLAVPLKVREDPHRKLAFSKDAQFPKLAFAAEEEAKPREEPVKPILTVKESNRLKKAKAKGKKHKLSKQVVNWLCETTTGEPELSIPSGRCFDNYVSWCRQRGEANVGFRVFTGIVKEELRLDDAKRNNGGQTMLPIKLSDPRQWSGFAPQRRKAA